MLQRAKTCVLKMILLADKPDYVITHKQDVTTSLFPSNSNLYIHLLKWQRAGDDGKN